MTEYKKVLSNRPKCQISGCDKEAKYDSAVKDGGGWMYLCAEHWYKIGCKTKGLYTNLDELAKRRHARGLD